MKGYFPRGAILSGFGEPSTLFKKVIVCNRCGYPALYWHKVGGAYRLHHWAIVNDGKPAFHLHRCGLQAGGAPSLKWPYPRKP